MELIERLESLYSELEGLKKKFRVLGEQLIAEGENLKGGSFFSKPSLLTDIDETVSEFKNLVNKMEEFAGEIPGLQVEARPRTLFQLSELYNSLLKKVEELSYIEEQVDKARQLIDTSKLLYLKEEDIEELEEFKKKLQAYENILNREIGDEEREELARKVAEGVHPLVELWKLNEETLLLGELEELYQSVKEEYGILLALAAVRGKLKLGGQAQEGDVPYKEEASLDVAAAAVEEIKEPVTPIRGGNKVEAEGEEEMDENPPGEEYLLYSYGQLEDTVVNMLSEEKFEPAFWISYYCYQQHGDFAFPPLLIRALDLALIIESGSGSSTEALKDVYQRLDIASVPLRGDTECRRRGLMLLTYITLLRPSFIAPETEASSYLGKMDLPPRLWESWQVLISSRGESSSEEHSTGNDNIFEAINNAEEELNEINQLCREEDALTAAAVDLCRNNLEMLRKELKKKKEIAGHEDHTFNEIMETPRLELKIPWNPAPETVRKVAEALLDLLHRERPEMLDKTGGEKYLKDSERKSPELNELNHFEDFSGKISLSKEERDYIKKMFDDMEKD